MGVGTNLLASVTGNPVLGVITIIDRRKLEAPDEGDPAKMGTKYSASTALAEMASDVVTAGLSSAPVDPTKLVSRGFNATSGSACQKQFEVQFNPAEITIQAQGGGMSQVTNFSGSTKKADKAGASITFQQLNPRIMVTIPLIFDRVVNADAFLQDKLALSPTSIIKNVGTAIATMAFKKEITVQTQVEGLIAVLRNDYTREIIFTWSDMSYYGKINGVNARYTMFSPTGKPIRATVDLNILCSDPKTSVGSMGQWEDRYKKAFVNPPNIIKNSTAGQAAGSIINLG